MILKVVPTITITNEHSFFENTEYANKTFEIVVNNLQRSDKSQLIESIQDLDDKEAGWIVFDKLFVSSDIVIEDNKGKAIKQNTPTYKKALYEYFPDIADVVTYVGI